ncbi:unnamed protein product [Leptidea sinapis]|uniref:Protein unc-80 homolog n=1 Tax=Leptidea sinapis TaxID=189913 RepID=A0A5E4Q5B6_9NEOP|nr:unnamed protein product [Leptidea sinapis]
MQFCQRAPGHHSLEKVLVQNLRFGLSSSLIEAIDTIPRWRLIQAALPHVMHSLASLLHNRLENGLKLWQALWEYRHPDAACFTTLVKPKPKPFGGKYSKKSHPGDIFLGRKFSKEEGVINGSPPSQNISISQSEAPSKQGSTEEEPWLRDISDDVSKQTQPRKRSNSLPIPKIEVSVYQSSEIKERDSLKNFIEVPDSRDLPLTEVPFSHAKIDDDNLMTRRASEKIKRKMKMSDLKAFVETKLLSKSEKALEKIGNDDHKFSFHTAEYHRSLDNSEERPNSALGSHFPQVGTRLTGDFLHCNLVKGKSMPSLRYIGEIKTERAQGITNMPASQAQKKNNPIITVTEHTPTPSPDYLSKTRQGSLESQMDSVSIQGSQHIPTPERKPSLTRSQTDSNISYIVEEIHEAPGSVHYITKDGDIDLQVVLKAESLRIQARNSLKQLREASLLKFTQRIKEMTKHTPFKELLDNLHATVGYCAEPVSMVSPMGQQKRNATKSNDLNGLGAQYANKFGSVQGPNKSIESFVIEAVLRVFVTRFALMHKELKIHGWRSPDEDKVDGATAFDASEVCAEERPHKKFTFKKRSTSSTGAHVKTGDESASQSPLSVRTRRHQLTPRQSERNIASVSSADITPHHKLAHSKSIPSKFHISGIMNWFRQKPQPQPLGRNGGDSGESLPISGSMASLARSHVTNVHVTRPVHMKRRVGYTLNRARKRVEDRLNRFGLRKMGKKRDGSIEETPGGPEGGFGGGDSEVVVLKRRRLVAAAPLYAGLVRFSFILDATQPGTTPDALFMAALLDLPHTVVVGRAAMLLECAHLVHNCNKGQWPYWLKSNIAIKNPVSVPSGSLLLKRQRLAGKLFYQWAEAIGNRLEEMLVEDKKHLDTVVSLVTDADGQRELLQQDEEEDFLDEASIRLPDKTIGADCPRALRMVACVLLFEITAFLRETYQNLPKSCRSSLKERGPWDRVYREANRRWSMALSSMGHSQASAQSLQSIAGVETERKISFVLHEPENVSGGSNVTLADAIPGSVDDKKGRTLTSRGKTGIHRRSTQQAHAAYGSFKRRSIKLRQKDTRETDEFINKRSDSIQSRRKVSSLSDRSDTSEVYPGAGVLSDDHDHPPDSPDSNSTDLPDHSKGYPWLKVMVKFLNSFNYDCCHQNFCHPYCFRRNMRATVRLMKSVRKVYGEKFGPEINSSSSEEGHSGTRRGRRPRKSSEHSTDRIDRSVLESVGIAYRAAGVEHTVPNTDAVPVNKPAIIAINAILRFQVIWKLRYQVWPRMEEGASMTFKVPPPGIEFTLPSPKIGIESLAVVDPPWSPQQRDDKKKAERESFLITTIPITRQASREPALDHVADDHVEPPPDEEAAEGVRSSHHTQVASALFPSVLCSAVAEIISLLDDAAVSRDGCSVYEVAYQVIWGCLVEDSALFLRHVLERLTRDHQDEMFKLLRHLIRFIPRLPQQAAFALYNYIIGYVMFYVRTPHEDGQRLIGAALSILWMDLKQILRKEQCDASILLTANVPAAKKIIVHGPSDNEGSIPSQFPVQEDTQFCQILRESLDYFGIPDKSHDEYFLVDFKTRQIHNSQSYVRDHYFFKRSQYPQLGLVHMKPEEAFDKLQHQELLHKFVEIGKVLLTWAILKNVDMVVQRVVFLHDELMKLPSFPRKALEADLVLYSRGSLGPTLLGLDVLHKFILETPSPDPLHIAELIKEEKPLKPIDFCYRDEDEMVNVLDCISLCVMVVSYSAESMRGYQMLYRRPRDVLLSLVGDFIGRATTRLLELNGSKVSGGSEGKPVELLDSKSHARLAEIAHSLLKVSPYDPESMGCRGLQRYMTQVLPAADWADDALRPPLIMILRRLDKVFLKIAKKPSIRRNTDWDSAAILLKGVYETMIRCPYIMHWQQIKTLLNTVQSLIVSDSNSGENLSSATAALMSQPPPPHFCSTVDSYSLEQMCGGSAIFQTAEKTENMLMNLFTPLCLRVGSGRKDVPPLRQSDVSYIVSVVLNALCPPAPPGQVAAVNAKLNAAEARANSLTFTGSRDTRNTTRLSNQLYRIAFLGNYCSSKWKVLKDNYTKHKKSIAVSSGQAYKKYKNWPWAELMRFLDDFNKNRSTEANINTNIILNHNRVAHKNT